MKVNKAETITRYHVTFDRGETKKLLKIAHWRTRISVNPQNECGQGLFTSTDFAALCEDIGIDRIYAHPTTLGVLPIGNAPEYADVVEFLRHEIGTKQP